jgi:hypothetical protein
MGFFSFFFQYILTYCTDVAQQILDLYISTSNRSDLTQYTKIKITLNEQAQNRGPDPIMDTVTKQELKQTSDWEFDGTSNPLDVVNTNQHTVSYHFS